MKRQSEETIGEVQMELEKANGESIQDCETGSGQTEEGSNCENELSGDVALSSCSKGPQKKKKRFSPVWKHFSIKNDDTHDKNDWAHCNYCVKKYPISGKCNGSTSNLIRHLRNTHPDVISISEPEEIEIIEFSQERYREALIKWIVTSNQPFTEVEQESFLELIKILNPVAITVSSQTVKRDIIRKFEERVKEMISYLKNVPGKMSFTIDAWTSKNCLPFTAIRAHWINSDWAYETLLLDFVHIDGAHDGKNFCGMFLKCLERFEISLSKVLALTMDNVYSNDTFMECLRKHGIEIGVNMSAKENRVRCMLHILNLAVQDILAILKIPLNYDEDVFIEDNPTGMSEGEEIDSDEEGEDLSNLPTVPKLRKLIKKVRKSPQMRQKLQQHCGFYKKDYLVPIIDVATRWNSTFQMLQRAEFLRIPLRALCMSEKRLSKYRMTEREWNDLNCIQALLAKFDRSSQLLSMQRHPTIAAYIPTINWLLESLQEFISDNPGPLSEAAENGLQKLTKYENELNIKSSLIPYVGTLLNPALKMNYFKENSNKTYQKEIQRTISELFQKEYESVEQIDAAETPVEEINDEFYLHMFKRAKTNKKPKEFQQYLGSPLSGVKVNVLDFWRSQQDELPHLSNMARDYFAVQSSSVSVERDFSDGVDLVTPTRCSLQAQTIRACMCLKSWYKSEKDQSR